MIGPEECRADALCQQQADGAADECAEHVRDGGVAQLPLEDQRQRREPETEHDVDRRPAAKRPKHEGRIRHRADEKHARKTNQAMTNIRGYDAQTSLERAAAREVWATLEPRSG